MSKPQYKEFDAGHTLVNVSRVEGPQGAILTAFVNGLSIRAAGSLALPRVAALFCECVITACNYEDTPEADAAAEALDMELRNHIDLIYVQA